MIDVRGRNRAGEMIAFKSCKTFDGGKSVLAGMEVLFLKLEEVGERRANCDRGALKHAGKGWAASEPRDRETRRVTANRGRNRCWARQALEGGIKLVAVRGHRGRPGGQGRSKGRRSRSGGCEMKTGEVERAEGGRMEG